jgi:hypothetical protein
MVDLHSLPKPRIEWSVTAGNLVSWVLIVIGFLWTASAFATKTVADNETDKVLAGALKLRVEKLDLQAAVQDNRLIAIETGVFYIRESLARLEKATNAK